MSAYTEGRPAPVISLLPVDHAFEENTALSDRFGGFAESLKKLEQALAGERSTNRKLRTDWAKAQEALFAQVKDAQARIKELEFTESRLLERAAESEKAEAAVRRQARSAELEHEQTRHELERYRRAWSGVLQREREAKLTIVDGQQIKQALADVERLNQMLQNSIAQERSTRVQLEREAKHRVTELENARARLEIFENRTAERSKEHTAEMEKLRESLEERLSSTRRESAELRKAIDALRLDRSAENERFARLMVEERKQRERLEWEMQKELRRYETASEMAKSKITYLENQISELQEKGRKFIHRLRARFSANRRKLRAMIRMRNDERSRAQAMSFYLVEEKRRFDSALESILAISPFDYYRLQDQIETIQKSHELGARVAGPANSAE